VDKQKQTVVALIVLLASILVVMVIIAIMMFAEDFKKYRPKPAGRLIIGQTLNRGGDYESSPIDC